MISQLNRFLKNFGDGKTLNLVLLFIGSTIGGLIELAGVALIFSFISSLTGSESYNHSYITDSILPLLANKNENTSLLIFAALICFIYLFKSTYSAIFKIFYLRLSRDYKRDISNRFMELYLQAPVHYHSSHRAVSAMTTMRNTINYCIYFFLLPIITLWSHLMIIAAIACYLLYFNLELTLLVGLFLFIVVLIQNKIVKVHAKKVGQRSISTIESNKSIILDNLNLAKDIKALHQESHFVNKFKDSNEKHVNMDIKIEFFQSLPAILSDGMLALTTLGIFAHTILTSPDQLLATFGTLIAATIRLTPSINTAILSMAQIHSAKEPLDELLSDFAELNSLAEERSLYPQKSMIINNELSLDGVRFSYGSNSEFMLTVNSLSIKRGEHVGIVGRSGAGKSTLTNIISGLHTPQSGNLLVDGTKIEQEHIHSLRKSIGFVQQATGVLNEKLHNNIIFGRKHSDSENMLQNALRISGLENFPNDNLGENGCKLSGGEKQRVAIARALYTDPDIIIFDEATSELDVESECYINQAIDSLRGKKTIISIAHRLSTLRKCDKIIYMDSGKIVDTGSFQELSSKYGNFSNLLELANISPLHKD